MNVYERYELWLNKLSEKNPLYRELIAVRGDDAEITDRFY